MFFLERHLDGKTNSIKVFLSLLNCVDSMDVCVTWVVWVRGSSGSRRSIKFWHGSKIWFRSKICLVQNFNVVHKFKLA